MRIEKQFKKALAGAFAVGLVTSGASAEKLRNRADVEVGPSLIEELTKGSEKVKVLVVAREARGVLQAMGMNSVQTRMSVAEASTASIREILGVTGDMGVMGGGPGSSAKYLWAANAIAAEVDLDTLEALKKDPTVQKIILDRELNWLKLDGEPTPAKPPLALPPPSPRPTNYGLQTIGADAAQAKGLTGEGVRVGHIDTGVDGNHPALKGKVAAFKDFVQGKTEAYDDQGHGTHSAGSIVADGVGVAPGAKLVVAKALNGQGGGSLSGLMESMQWMLDPDGDPSTDDQPRLVSNSWGADLDALGDSKEIFRDVVKAWREAGIIPVFANGNSGEGTRSAPGGYPEAFSVGATDQQDQIADFSSGAPVEWNGETFVKPDVSAPGVDIVSTYLNGKYARLDGTSMACPHVAGALALLLQANPSLTVDQATAAFKSSAKDLGEPGKDIRFGEGRIDVMKALEAASAAGKVVAVPGETALQ